MDHLGIRNDYFYNLRERACAKMILDHDANGALDMEDTMDSSTANGSSLKWKEYLTKAVSRSSFMIQ